MIIAGAGPENTGGKELPRQPIGFGGSKHPKKRGKRRKKKEKEEEKGEKEIDREREGGQIER